MKKLPEKIATRLSRIISTLHFILNYYTQYHPKLLSTILRLEEAAREKVKVLIDVGKWTV